MFSSQSVDPFRAFSVGWPHNNGSGYHAGNMIMIASVMRSRMCVCNGHDRLGGCTIRDRRWCYASETAWDESLARISLVPDCCDLRPGVRSAGIRVLVDRAVNAG